MKTLFPLRPLQQKALDGLRQSLRSGKKRPVISAPTGMGKTILGAHIVAGALAKKNRVAFVVPALSLIDQTFERFQQNGIDPADMGVMQADHPWRRPHAPVQICSIQTLAKRGFPEVNLAIIDECHLSFEAINRWQKEKPGMIFVGLSATPWAKSMGDRWDDLIVPTSIDELIKIGDLSKFRVFTPSHPDLSGVKIVAGDYHEGQLSEVMSDKTLIGDAVSNWLERGEGRPTLAFCVDRGHAQAMHDSFVAAGVTSAYVDANTPREAREDMKRKFSEGEIKVIVSIGTMTTGVDLDVRCIIFARPTKSEILFTQCIGRGLRTAEGKDACIIFDHSDTTLRLGLVTDIKHERLRTSKGDESERKRPKAKVPEPFECIKCQCLVPVRAPECPNCGHKSQRQTTVFHADGELVEFGKEPAKKFRRDKLSEIDFIGQLRGYAAERSYKEGWCAMKFKEKYGVWPNAPAVKYALPIPCGDEVRSWIISRNIAYAKSKKQELVSLAREAVDLADAD